MDSGSRSPVCRASTAHHRQCVGCNCAGRLLIYSTCTYNRCENEDIVKYIIAEHGAEPVRLDMPREWNITAGVGGEDYCYRFLPHKTRGEGLFVCVLRKPGEESCGRAMSQDKRRSQGRTVAAKIPDSVKNWLCGSGDYTFSMQDGSVVTAMPEAFVRDSVMIQSKVKTLSCGVEVGVLKRERYCAGSVACVGDSLEQRGFCYCRGGLCRGYIILARRCCHDR